MELMSGLRPSDSEGLDRHRQALDRSVRNQVVHIAGEPTLPSLLALKHTSASDSQNIGEAQGQQLWKAFLRSRVEDFSSNMRKLAGLM
jgi:hypothetical protein